MRALLAILIPAILISCHVSKHDIKSCHCSQCMDIKIGQMLVAGFKGIAPSPYIEEAIQRYHIGGVIYFDVDVSDDLGERNVRDPKQLFELSAALQKLADEAHPLFIAIDQEGGVVNRLKAKYGFPETVSAAYLGQTGNLDSTSLQMSKMAKTISDCGINIDFAPCVDLVINPLNPIIAGKERSFSANADSVTMYSRIVVEEMNKHSVLTSLKHFPGHGSSHTDSHLGLVDITDYWRTEELIPYRKLIEEGYNDIVMVGHLINKNIDSLPASLSSKTITGLLRNELGYKGVVATDDMNMGAIVQNYSLEKALSLAINAGVNMIVMGNNAKEFEPDLVSRSHGIIKRLVESGEISNELIDDSYDKIMELKSRTKSTSKF